MNNLRSRLIFGIIGAVLTALLLASIVTAALDPRINAANATATAVLATDTANDNVTATARVVIFLQTPLPATNTPTATNTPGPTATNTPPVVGGNQVSLIRGIILSHRDQTPL